MVIPAAGAVVLVRFPFSDLSQAKLRPAVVLADAGLPALPPRVPPRVLVAGLVAVSLSKEPALSLPKGGD
jgi:hypothetical protein